jgi:hypothetical protein
MMGLENISTANLVVELGRRGVLLGNAGWIDLWADAITEAEKAMIKYPQPNYVITKFAEEAGEVVKDAIHCAEARQSYTALRGEMKQTLAMMYRLWVEGDQVHGLLPVGEMHGVTK